MSALSVRSFIFLGVSAFLQLFIILLVGEEVHAMNRYAGRMHLCDFGAGAGVESDCGGRSNCRGPGGSNLTAARLYAYDIWALRTFLRDSLAAVLPDEALIEEEFHRLVDPGDWGLENLVCRYVCAFIFMMGVSQDFTTALDIASLLWRLPLDGRSWVRYDVPEWGEKENIKLVKGLTELDFVRFGIGSMPRKWKVLNVMFVVVPKFVLWFLVCHMGFFLLMETGNIMNSLMNSLALTFLLEVDKLVFQVLTTRATQHMMERLTDEDDGEDEDAGSSSEDEDAGDGVAAESAQPTIRKKHSTLQAYYTQEVENPWLSRRLYCTLIPRRLMRVLAMTAIFTAWYYYTGCAMREDGSVVSAPMFLPAEGLNFDAMLYFFNYDVPPPDARPYWTMPDG